MAKKTVKNQRKPASISIAFTQREIDWLLWVMEYVMTTIIDYPVGESVRDKIIVAKELLQNVDKVLNEGTKVRKVDARKRSAPRPRRKGARR